ncbi:DUF1810 domain-containing protein [Parapusillimonas sp. SGNA-6]|nr:DUF1810 domain-containing protein [Parapusillimonas sp. SGNA-6]
MDTPQDDGPDPYRLQRFVDAQRSTYGQALSELRAGRKRSHWMWFIFPQIEGLGHSAMAQAYAISGLDEARAYVRHPVLGPRLRACTQAVNAVNERGVDAIFGYPDDLKFHSSMTLFAATGEDAVFQQALDKYFKGAGDRATLDRLGEH